MGDVDWTVQAHHRERRRGLVMYIQVQNKTELRIYLLVGAEICVILFKLVVPCILIQR